MTARNRKFFALALTFLCFAGTAVFAEDVTLEGSFIWARGADGDLGGDLTAVLTPAGDNVWSVAFHFVWEEEPKVYEGEARGNISNGPFAGEANDNERELAFLFSGNFENGAFQGEHRFVKEDGTEVDTGTFELSRPESAPGGAR